MRAISVSSVYWDPNPVAFHIPIIGHPVVWYGVLFALGFFVGCLVTRRVTAHYLSDYDPALDAQARRRLAASYTDRLLLFTVIGTVIGARLGHILFYDLGYYLQHPIQIFKVWQGGLASHGAALGIVLSLVVLRLRPKKPFPRQRLLELLDIVVVPAALIGVFIRAGNFVNQELIGIQTAAPWGVVFGSPADGAFPMARHPVQLYEALAYLVVFVLLALLVRLREVRGSRGLVSGVFFLLVFGARFWLEFFKENQSALLVRFPLDMGQVLSLPLVLVGAGLIGRCLLHAWYHEES